MISPLHREPSESAIHQESTHPVYVGDLANLPTQEGWLYYLAVVIDLDSRQVVG